jgi:hypothetical protein
MYLDNALLLRTCGLRVLEAQKAQRGKCCVDVMMLAGNDTPAKNMKPRLPVHCPILESDDFVSCECKALFS